MAIDDEDMEFLDRPSTTMDDNLKKLRIIAKLCREDEKLALSYVKRVANEIEAIDRKRSAH